MKTPVVAILGHVDHGKTTLLDAIRGSNVAEKEAGGITQKIGAFQITHKNKKITFIDTPGHAAFAKMRSRGANVADVAILVVAVNDGVQPQTKESIAHINASGIPFIVALTKTDLPNISFDKVKKQLAVAGVQVEGFGGDVVCVPVSAKEKIGLEELLDMIVLIWEMQSSPIVIPAKAGIQKSEPGKTEKNELVVAGMAKKRGRKSAVIAKQSCQKRNKKDEIATSPAAPRNDKIMEDNRFVVIESYLDNKKGSVIHAIIKSGQFKIGDKIFIDGAEGRVRTLINDKGQHVQGIEEGDPVEILGLATVPAVGSVGSDSSSVIPAKAGIQNQQEKTNPDIRLRGDDKAEVDKSIRENPPHQNEFGAGQALEIPASSAGGRVNTEEDKTDDEKVIIPPKKLNIILRADNEGSLEAIKASFPEEIDLILSGTGNISESDILLAKTTKSFVVGFNVWADHSVEKLAETEGVMLKIYKIIYEMLEELSEVAASINEVMATEKIVGRATILQDFLGTKNRIAGCRVIEGKFNVGDRVRVERGEKLIGEAKIDSIKVFKKDVQRASMGQECGFVLLPELDFRVKDDIISARPIVRK